MRDVRRGRWLWVVLFIQVSYSQHHDSSQNLASTYSNLLVQKYGDGGVVSSSVLDTLIEQLTCDPESCVIGKNTSAECVCLGKGLLSHLGVRDSLTAEEIGGVATAILYAAQNNNNCSGNDSIIHDGKQSHQPPSTYEVWGYSFVCVTLINLCSLMGMLFIPLMKKTYYQKLLMYMVALAVGTLTGSSLLFLIPGAFGMGDEDSPYRHEYIWKLTVVIGGIYLFFLVERILSNFLGHTHAHKEQEEVKSTARHCRHRTTSGCSAMSDGGEEPLSSIKFHTVSRVEDSMNMSFKVPAMVQHAPPDPPATSPTESNVGLLSPIPDAIVTNGSTSPTQIAPPPDDSPEKPQIKNVAWMIIFGDGLHNFIDGLSIGAAFAGSTLAGISVSVAVICEELPHELGDFAILLDSGMSMRQALMYNFLSACMCYLGLVLGILAGELEHGSQWIFAVAGGMFLYIALCDMLPEVNHAGEEEARMAGNKWKVFLLQNAGLISGFGIMLILALYAEHIDFS